MCVWWGFIAWFGRVGRICNTADPSAFRYTSSCILFSCSYEIEGRLCRHVGGRSVWNMCGEHTHIHAPTTSCSSSPSTGKFVSRMLLQRTKCDRKSHHSVSKLPLQLLCTFLISRTEELKAKHALILFSYCCVSLVYSLLKFVYLFLMYLFTVLIFIDHHLPWEVI